MSKHVCPWCHQGTTPDNPHIHQGIWWEPEEVEEE